jgi:putative transposase
LPTIWELPDDLWEEVEPILDCFYPRSRTGRPRADLRVVFDGIIHRLRSGCQWSQLPERFGASSTVHGWFQRFAADGLLEEVWAYLVRECEELGGVHWEWQAADGVMGKSRHDGNAGCLTMGRYGVSCRGILRRLKSLLEGVSSHRAVCPQGFWR